MPLYLAPLIVRKIAAFIFDSLSSIIKCCHNRLFHSSKLPITSSYLIVGSFITKVLKNMMSNLSLLSEPGSKSLTNCFHNFGGILPILCTTLLKAKNRVFISNLPIVTVLGVFLLATITARFNKTEEH
jgi:hypothetical protein